MPVPIYQSWLQCDQVTIPVPLHFLSLASWIFTVVLSIMTELFTEKWLALVKKPPLELG
jgi:hypothetical protein